MKVTNKNLHLSPDNIYRKCVAIERACPYGVGVEQHVSVVDLARNGGAVVAEGHGQREVSPIIEKGFWIKAASRRRGFHEDGRPMKGRVFVEWLKRALGALGGPVKDSNETGTGTPLTEERFDEVWASSWSATGLRASALGLLEDHTSPLEAELHVDELEPVLFSLLITERQSLTSERIEREVAAVINGVPSPPLLTRSQVREVQEVNKLHGFVEGEFLEYADLLAEIGMPHASPAQVLARMRAGYESTFDYEERMTDGSTAAYEALEEIFNAVTWPTDLGTS